MDADGHESCSCYAGLDVTLASLLFMILLLLMLTMLRLFSSLSQADYDARAVRKTPPSHEHRNIRLLSPGVAEDEANITGSLQVMQENTSGDEVFEILV